MGKWIDGLSASLAGRFGFGGEEAREPDSRNSAAPTERQVILLLREYRVSASHARSIYQAYGDEALRVVQKEPYRIGREVRAIGFAGADKIARAQGHRSDAPQRVQAGIQEVMHQFTEQGHVLAPRAELVRVASRLLKIHPERIDKAVRRMALFGDLVVEGDDVYETHLYRAERDTARRLREILECRWSRLANLDQMERGKAIRYAARQASLKLTPPQRAAIQLALTYKVSILTGGPGTGKTTTLRALIQALKKTGHSFRLAAPTGLAAKRLGEATEEFAETLHRLLQFRPLSVRPGAGNGFPDGGFQRNRRNPIDADLVLVDEASMLDQPLLEALLQAIDPASHVLFVGDPDQLPSVGPGKVLRDLIDSKAIPVASLSQVFRQAEESQIVVNAHRIKQGRRPLAPRKARDFFMFAESEPERAAARVVERVKEWLPARFQLDPLDDIQVLSPVYRGAAGVDALNAALQAALNPPGDNKSEYRQGRRVLRLGDKVLQLRNNYRKEVMNGDSGRIAAIDVRRRLLVVNLAGREVKYEFGELEELGHAFALSVHKAQGNEYQAVVIPVLPESGALLQRNLLYTAVTRAKQVVVLIGAREAIAMAVKNDRQAQRYTRLASRLAPRVSRNLDAHRPLT